MSQSSAAFTLAFYTLPLLISTFFLFMPYSAIFLVQSACPFPYSVSLTTRGPFPLQNISCTNGHRVRVSITSKKIFIAKGSLLQSMSHALPKQAHACWSLFLLLSLPYIYFYMVCLSFCHVFFKPIFPSQVSQSLT